MREKTNDINEFEDALKERSKKTIKFEGK